MTRTAPTARRESQAVARPRVEDVLREIAYRLHTTRKVRPEEAWPVVARGENSGRPARRTAASASR